MKKLLCADDFDRAFGPVPVYLPRILYAAVEHAAGQYGVTAEQFVRIAIVRSLTPSARILVDPAEGCHVEVLQ
jgi:hypothetical protein